MRASFSLFSPLELLARAVAGVSALKIVWDRRRLVGQMASFDDHMLRDIGLTRADLDCALADPMLTDPTYRLAIRAREARSNQRAAALEQHQWAHLLGSADRSAADRDRRAA